MTSYTVSAAEIQQLFPLYQRWETEGRPRHGHGGQYYYDCFHKVIEPLENGAYRFNIQTFDSVEGDVWARGTFVIDDGKVQITEQKLYEI